MEKKGIRRTSQKGIHSVTKCRRQDTMIKKIKFVDYILVEGKFFAELSKIIQHYDIRSQSEEIDTVKSLTDKINVVNVIDCVRQSNIQLTCCSCCRNSVKTRLRCSLFNCTYTLRVLQQDANQRL